MPRGVPKSGVRMTKKRLEAGAPVPAWKAAKLSTVELAPVVVETDDEIRVKLDERFAALSLMAQATMEGTNKSLIVSGPAGVGKSHGIMKMAEQMEADGKQVVVVKGFVRPTGLYRIFYENRFENCVIVFDDADPFGDDVSLNLLKAACDMTRSRRLSWLTETKMEDEEGERLPRNFEFEGSVIFITNYDFDDMIARGSRLAPHFEALISRSIYLDLAMKTNRDYIVRIQQVLEDGMLRDEGITKKQEKEIMAFIETNAQSLRELSLRMVRKIATIMKMNEKTWEQLARVTCLRQVR